MALLGFWGFIFGIVDGPVEAFYADNVPKGERSKYYVILYVVWLLSGSLGPASNIVMFSQMGD